MKLKINFVCILLIIAATSVAVHAKALKNTRNFHSEGRYGAVSTGHPLATKAAIKILKNGGNAVDAAICAGFVLGVVDFTNSGLGGDAFALIHLPNGQTFAWDASSPKPKAYSNNKSHIGLPTVPNLFHKLLKVYGSKSRVELLKPAIRAAQKGFKVTAYLENVVKKKLLKLNDSNAISFLTPQNLPLLAGQVFRQPQLAQTLILLSQNGLQSFYSNPLSELLLKDMQARGSSYTQSDFARFSPRPSLPYKMELDNFTLLGNNLPSSSIVSMTIIKYLLANRLNLFPADFAGLKKLLTPIRQILEYKYSELSNYVQNPHEFILKCLTSLEKQKTKPLTKLPDTTNTTHLCVWDKNGMIVSMTLTLGSHCGTGELSPLGFFYNNEMKNFTPLVAKYPPNYSQKLGPISSKSPLIVLKNNKPYLTIGGAGSNRIISNVAITTARLLTSEKKIQKSVNSPRFFLNYKNILQTEWTPNTKFLKKLITKADNVKIRPLGDDYFGLVTGIIKPKDKLIAFADFRRDGACLAIKSNPEEEKNYKVNLILKKSKGLKSFSISKTNRFSGQETSEWEIKTPHISVQQTENNYKSFNLISTQTTVLLSQTFKTLPNDSSSDKPVWLEKPQLSDKELQYLTKVPAYLSGNNLVEWLITDICYNFPFRKTRKIKTAEDLLANGYGDCAGKARLFRRILCHKGINTRLIGGLIFEAGIKTKNHIWVESYLNGKWTAICPTNAFFGTVPKTWLKLKKDDEYYLSPSAKPIFFLKEISK